MFLSASGTRAREYTLIKQNSIPERRDFKGILNTVWGFSKYNLVFMTFQCIPRVVALKLEMFITNPIFNFVKFVINTVKML